MVRGEAVVAGGEAKLSLAMGYTGETEERTGEWIDKRAGEWEAGWA